MPTVDHEKPFSAKLTRSSLAVPVTKSRRMLATVSHSLAILATLSCTSGTPSMNFTRRRRPLSHNLSFSTAARSRMSAPRRNGTTRVLSTRSFAAS